MQTIELPPPGYPMLTRVVSHAIFTENGREDPLTWAVTQPHPLVPEWRIVRMFVDRGGVEVYSVAEGGLRAVRNLIPMTQIRLIEEEMPLSVFVDELAAAEDDGDDDDDDDEGGGEGKGGTGDTAPASAPSGQVTP